MKLKYKLIVDNPSSHQVTVEIHGEFEKNQNMTHFFLPRWSPGSYLIREYSRHLTKLKAESENGEVLHFEQVDISSFDLDLSKSETKKTPTKFKISYNVFCHELTVRTCHVDSTHAYLHLPCLLMGILDKEINEPQLELVFPPLWSHVVTGLKDISPKREVFLYSAKNYDELIDSPIEIGCLHTDGFRSFDRDHEIAFYGEFIGNKDDQMKQIKKDTKAIVEHIGGFFKGVPYEKYTFMTHLVPGLYGGLEHLNSTALQYDPTGLHNRKGYLNYLCLVSHEYFHLWNVKRIRPKELGPFDYLKEATTHLLWLAEGLTSLMDELFVYRAGLMSLEEYLDMQKDNLNRYLAVPGRKFHSLNDSSFNAWIKLYRPDENTNNSSVSYYLKGGIAFWVFNFHLAQKGKSINDLLNALWTDYQKNPGRGVTAEDVFKMVENIAGVDSKNYFKDLVSLTEELDFETIVSKVGLKLEWENSDQPYLGMDVGFEGDRVVVKTVHLDGPAYKSGLNAGDEILAIDGLRLLKDRYNELPKFVRVNQTYAFTVSRLHRIMNIDVNIGVTPRRVKALSIVDKTQVEKALNP